MLHCLWRLPHVASQVQLDHLVADTGIGLNILSGLGEYWTEVKRARDCIHELSGATVQRLIKARGLEFLRPYLCHGLTLQLGGIFDLSIRMTQQFNHQCRSIRLFILP